MKVYRLIDQVLIVSPKSFDLKAVLARCATLLSIPLALAALLTSFTLFHYQKAAPLYYSAPAGSALKMESNIASYAADRMMEIPAPTNAPIAVPTQWVEEIITPFPDLPEVAEGILIGAVLVIIVGLIFDFYRKR
ncbi:MAG: hypothetical protein BWY45_02647 [Euryarchaeota archaeon ADurb.Bin294]|nr:MAG: hypothetical protein BWY45_02647 [Euryarchaeota archaeon ADurb.Bin294]